MRYGNHEYSSLGLSPAGSFHAWEIRQGKARQGKARQGKARQGKAKKLLYKAKKLIRAFEIFFSRSEMKTNGVLKEVNIIV